MAGKTVSVFLNDEEYQEVEKQAQEKGVSVSRYIKNAVLTDGVNEKSMKDLIRRVSELNDRTAFTVKMVFGTDWATIGGTGVKLTLGRTWYAYVLAGNIPSIKPTHKDSANVQWYIKGDK